MRCRQLRANRQRQLIECDRHPAGHRLLDGELVVGAAQVLHKHVAAITTLTLRPA